MLQCRACGQLPAFFTIVPVKKRNPFSLLWWSWWCSGINHASSLSVFPSGKYVIVYSAVPLASKLTAPSQTSRAFAEGEWGVFHLIRCRLLSQASLVETPCALGDVVPLICHCCWAETRLEVCPLKVPPSCRLDLNTVTQLLSSPPVFCALCLHRSVWLQRSIIRLSKKITKQASLPPFQWYGWSYLLGRLLYSILFPCVSCPLFVQAPCFFPQALLPFWSLLPLNLAPLINVFG